MKTRTRLASSIAVAALLLSACGGGAADVADDPKAAVLAAFQKAEDWKGAEITMRLLSDVPSMLAMDDGDGDMSPDIARLVLESYVRIRATDSGTSDDTADDQFDMVVHVGDFDAFEMRAVDGRVFFRADVPALIEEFDDGGTARADMEQFLSEARGMGLGFLDAAVEGEWLELTGAEQFADMVAGMTGQPQVDPSEAEAAGVAILEQVGAFVEQDVTVTYVGSDDAGERTRLTATAADAIDLMEEVLAAGGSLVQQAYNGIDPAEMIDELRREAGAEADAVTLPLDVWIKGGTVSRIGFDLVAFAELNPDLMKDEPMPEGVSTFAIVADIANFGGGVDVPSDPVEVNLFEIFGTLMGGFGAGFDQAA